MGNIEIIQSKIYTIRGVLVMLDSDIANVYGVETRVLNQAVKRNLESFPEDFMFQLTAEEFRSLKSQIVTSNWGGARKLPYAFTEVGVSMLSAVLKSTLAVRVKIAIMRAFVASRKMASINPEYELLKEKLEKIEARMDALEADNVVDRMRVTHKVKELSEDVKTFFESLNQLQNGYIVVQRPEDGLGTNQNN